LTLTEGFKGFRGQRQDGDLIGSFIWQERLGRIRPGIHEVGAKG
jgi:hypothetical protein